MADTKLREAAERRRDPQSAHSITSEQRQDDADILADAYLALVPADSEQLIDEAWLRSVAPVVRSVKREDCVEYLVAGKLDIECYFGRRWVLVCGALIVELKNRGHAFRLLSDLNLTTPAGSSEPGKEK